MRRLLTALAFLASLIGAQAQDIGASPPYSTPATQLYPDTTLNFGAGTYAGLCASADACLTAARASAIATDLTYFDLVGASFTTYAANTLRIKSGWGLLKEDNHTNFLLHSCIPSAGTICDTGPATQTTGNLTNGINTLWVNGSGSATLSNGTATGCIGTATQGFPATFTVAGAGTCTVTVTGSLNQFQLEFGAATSFLPTAGTTVARGTESITATSQLATLLAATQGFEVISSLGEAGLGVLLNRNSGTTNIFSQFLTATTVRAFAGVAITASPKITGLAGTNSTGAPNKVATSWGSSGISISWNNGSVNHSDRQFVAAAPNLEIGGAGTTSSVNTFITSLAAGSSQPSDVALKNGTAGWAPVELIFPGDSQTVGFGSTNPYPNQLMALLPLGVQAYPYKNSAVSGQAATTVVSLWPSQTLPFIDTTIPKCVTFPFAGGNDIAGGASPATAEATTKQMWLLSKASNCLTIATTTLPRVGGMAVSEQTFATNIADLNARVRADTAFYDGLNDVALEPHIGAVTEFTATITGTNMTVSAMVSNPPVPQGTIQFGNSNKIYGPNITAGTTVTSQTSGTAGGAGVYVVTPSQTAASGDVIEQPDINYYQADGTHLTAAGDAFLAAGAYTATAGILH